MEVLGPEATEPEHAGNFVGPLPEYMLTFPGSPCQVARSARRMTCDHHRSSGRGSPKDAAEALS